MHAPAATPAPEPPPRTRPKGDAFIPPAVPLVACDPYFSVWSCADRLTDDATRHWTGKPHSLTSMVRIDGKPFRLMGAQPEGVAALPQTKLEILPTRTIYEFRGPGVSLRLTFTTPMFGGDADMISRPVTYLAWDCWATDKQSHAVSVYFDASSELVVNEPSQAVAWSQAESEPVDHVGPLKLLRIGSQEQPVLAKKGDNLRIDWGHLYVAAPQPRAGAAVVAAQEKCRGQFAAEGKLPAADARQPRPVADETPVAAVTFDLGKVGQQPVQRWLMLVYDDLYSIQYFQQNLRAFWRRRGAGIDDLLKTAARDFEPLKFRCNEFDTELVADLTKVGGERFARIGVLAYRQCLAGNKVAADAAGQPLLFPKENFSNGCIATVDVIYPMAPQLLLFNPSLAKAMLVPILDYAASPRWQFPFAPHDLGTYPLANGQVYGGGERTEKNQMPVEETGNMLILLAALAEIEGHADFAGRYWPLLVKWAEYLKAKGFDPENQLCTDDFAGHLAHNVNLSAKAIVALGAFAKLCALRGDKPAAAEYEQLAREFAARWAKEAADGDHFRLAFDKPDTWSQKYNLVWDRILGLKLFPPEVLRKEMDFYKKTQQRYGLPLDNRKLYTKLDWTVWTATLTGERADFDALVAPVYEFLLDAPHRVPMTDWYWTQDAKKVGFQARPVVGGVLIPLLYDRGLWRKWAARDVTKAAGWAPPPPRAQTK